MVHTYELQVGSVICKYLWEFHNQGNLIITTDIEGKSQNGITNKGLAHEDQISPVLFSIVTYKIYHVA